MFSRGRSCREGCLGLLPVHASLWSMKLVGFVGETVYDP
jgi:hypothetical protein